jgi:SulP family sulfate permease
MSVLAGIAVYVGLNILDWSFIQRTHKVNIQAMVIMYAVMLLTVFVDLIVAVGLGVFISNIIIIDKLSKVQARKVKAISDGDDNVVPLSISEGELLDKADGKVLFFYLSGPMIFSVSKAISRQHASISDYQVIILDLTDVPMIDVTVGLALENAVRDALYANCEVLLVCPNTETRQPLEKFHVLTLISKKNNHLNREQALQTSFTHISR